MPIRRFIPPAAFAVALGLAVPALASSRQAPRPHGGAAPPYARTSIPTKKSTNFAGYRINAKNGMTDVTATIVVPKVKCTKTNRAIGASVGLNEDSTSNPSSAHLFIGCVKGKARYFPYLTVNGHRHDYPKAVAHPGDMVTLEAVGDPLPGETTVSVFDQTHSFSKTKNGTGYSSFVANPWIGDLARRTKSGAALGVPNFGEIDFTTATLNGTPFGSLTPQVRVNRYNATTLQIKTGAYDASEQAFASIFKHS